MASKWYPAGLAAALDAALDLTDATKVKVALTTTTYNSVHNAYDDVSASTVDTPKVVGGSPAFTVSTTVVKYDAADPATWSALAAGSTITAGIVYYDSGTPSTSYLLAFLDCTDTPTNGGDITLAFNAAGIGTIDCA
jgi:hypothetical protein